VLDVLVQKRRNKHAALKFLRRLLKNQGIHPEAIVRDKLASYRAAANSLGLAARHQPGGLRENNTAENSHLAIRRQERKQQKFKSQGSVQRFLSTHAAVYNTYNLQQHLISRPGLRRLRAQADAAWAAASIAAQVRRRGRGAPSPQRPAFSLLPSMEWPDLRSPPCQGRTSLSPPHRLRVLWWPSATRAPRWIRPTETVGGLITRPSLHVRVARSVDIRPRSLAKI
jgi:hypothetical protein